MFTKTIKLPRWLRTNCTRTGRHASGGFNHSLVEDKTVFFHTLCQSNLRDLIALEVVGDGDWNGSMLLQRVVQLVQDIGFHRLVV